MTLTIVFLIILATISVYYNSTINTLRDKISILESQIPLPPIPWKPTPQEIIKKQEDVLKAQTEVTQYILDSFILTPKNSTKTVIQVMEGIVDKVANDNGVEMSWGGIIDGKVHTYISSNANPKQKQDMTDKLLKQMSPENIKQRMIF